MEITGGVRWRVSTWRQTAGVRRITPLLGSPLAGLLAAMLAGALLVTAGPAAAHSEDPQVVTVLDGVAPALPAVDVRVVTSVAPQLLLVDRGTQPVEVLDERGRPFLRIGPRVVQADLARVATYQSQNPFGSAALPAAVTRDPDGPARFAEVATGSSYGWFDHRMHPAAVAVSDAVRAAGLPTRLAEFTIPLRVGPTLATLRGHLEFRPQLGGFDTRADPPPAGLSAVVLQAATPGLAVSAGAGHTAVISGAQGEPFARLGPTGAEINERSPTWAADAQGRGVPVRATDPRAAPVWRRIAGTPSITWVDPRLRWADQLPPDSALASDVPVVLRRWSVPVTVDGRPAALAGTVSWQPDPARHGEAKAAARHAAAAAAAAAAPTGSSSSHRTLIIAGAIAGTIAALALALARVLTRRRRASAPGPAAATPAEPARAPAPAPPDRAGGRQRGR